MADAAQHTIKVNKKSQPQLHQQELNQSKKTIVPTDESLNTKNFIKKMTGKKNSQLDDRNQSKITQFINFSNSTTLGTARDQHLTNLINQDQDQRVRQLEERIKKKDLQIQKMKRNKEIQQNKYSLLFIQNKQYKKKSRAVIAKSMLEAAQLRRRQRRQINPKLGYFKDNGRTFVQGSILINLRKKVKQKQQYIRQLEQEKKSKNQDKKQRAMFKIDFTMKEIAALNKQIQFHSFYVNDYKEQLKLADREETCQYAKNDWKVVYDRYQPLELLGKGGFGEVYKVYDLERNQVVALKVNKFSNDEDEIHRAQFLKHVQREADIMKNLDHPNIGRFLDLVQCCYNIIAFTLQFCTGPDLAVYLRKHKCFEQKQAKQIIKQIFSALYYMSTLKEKIIHYDLKPSNIMLHNGLVKILDFGLCKPMDGEKSKIQLTSQGVGTYWYLPPETFNENLAEISQKVDIWSAGVIFFQILYGRKPFGHGVSQNKIYQQGIILQAKKVDFPIQTPKKFKVSEAAKQFIRDCLKYDPQQRLSPQQAYNHQYLKK